MKIYYGFTGKVLLTLGIDIDQTSKHKVLMSVLRHSTPFLIFLCSLQLVFSFIFEKADDFMNLEALCTTFFTIQSLIKNLTVVINQKKLSSLRNRLNILFETFDNDEKTKSLIYLRRIRNICYKLFVWAMIVIWSINLLPLITMFYSYVVGSKVVRSFPYQMWYPFYSFSYYFSVYFYNLYVGQIFMISQIIMDHYFVLIVFDLVAHFDQLGEKFQIVINEASEETSVENRKRFKTLIENHAALIDISDELNKVYGIALLVLVLTSSFIVAVVGFIITVS